MHCGTALQWCMVPFHAVQHSTTPLVSALHTLYMAQVLVADAGETLIGYTGMVKMVYCLKLSDPFACCYFPHVCILA